MSTDDLDAKLRKIAEQQKAQAAIDQSTSDQDNKLIAERNQKSDKLGRTVLKAAGTFTVKMQAAGATVVIGNRDTLDLRSKLRIFYVSLKVDDGVRGRLEIR